MTTLVVHAMSRAEMDLAVEWAAAEGWNPGLDDADAFFAADQLHDHVGIGLHQRPGIVFPRDLGNVRGTAFGFVAR